MKRTILFAALTLLLLPWTKAEAQQQLYVCHADSCAAYDVNNLHAISLTPTVFHIDELPAYVNSRVDSIVFRRPNLVVEEMGWWGDVQQGSSHFLAVLPDSTKTFRYHVAFNLVASFGVCQSASCELRFDEEWQQVSYRDNDSLTDQNDPYIYVKETLTGPRKFELWVMNNPVVPIGCPVSEEGCLIEADCTNLLAGRPMGEVQTIVETWVYGAARIYEPGGGVRLTNTQIE